MNPGTAARLTALNARFYAEFGPAFAATRRRIQPGVRRVLSDLPDQGRWLDLGCGPGALGVEWLRQGRQSSYLGLDFSDSLLEEARAAVRGQPAAQVSFTWADLSAPDWPAGLAPDFAGGLAFAVLHHLPSTALRERLLRQVHSLLADGGLFIHSEWQFQHSPKLMARRVPWESAGVDPSDLEPGDTLLDWRYALPGQPEHTGLRYVHLFERGELEALARASGFHGIREFESDGQGGRLGLYQVWEK